MIPFSEYTKAAGFLLQKPAGVDAFLVLFQALTQNPAWISGHPPGRSAQVLAVGGCGVCPHRVGHVVAEADVVHRSGGQDGLVVAADDLLYRKQFHSGPPCPCDAG